MNDKFLYCQFLCCRWTIAFLWFAETTVMNPFSMVNRLCFLGFSAKRRRRLTDGWWEKSRKKMALGGGHVHNGTTILQEYESKIPGRKQRGEICKWRRFFFEDFHSQGRKQLRIFKSWKGSGGIDQTLISMPFEAWTPEPGEESQNARPDGLTLKSAQKEAAVAAAALAAVGSSDGVIWRPAIAITPAKLSMSLLKIKGLVASFVHCCRQLHSAASLEEAFIIPTLARTCFLELCIFVGMMRQQEEEEEDTTQEDGQTRAAMLLVANKQTTEKAHKFCWQQQILEVVGRTLRELSQSSFGFREWLGSSLSSKQIPKCPRESANLNGVSGGGWMWGRRIS